MYSETCRKRLHINWGGVAQAGPCLIRLGGVTNTTKPQDDLKPCFQDTDRNVPQTMERQYEKATNRNARTAGSSHLTLLKLILFGFFSLCGLLAR
jgi:hypothetical protein